MRRTHGAVGGAVGVLLAALALGACDDEPPPPNPSESATLPTSPSPSESSSSPPEAESPQEFIRRWIGLQTGMQNTGETEEFRQASRGCQPCDSFADRVDRIYAAGGYVTTDGWTPTSFQRVSQQGEVVVYRVAIRNALTTYAEKKGGPDKTLPAGDGLIEFTLRGSSGAFVVSGLIEVST